jgi:2-oxo-4-hydroxy-4-carboxy-5-ureidoimidazoline decarboxylase
VHRRIAKRLRVTISLDQLNAIDAAAFIATVGDIFEHGPWVAERAYAARPFATVAALHEAMMQAVRAAPRSEQLVFLRGHPELGGRVARAGAMTDDSKSEQGGLGLDRLSEEEFARFERLNAAYALKFGFPFIVGVRRHTRDSILAQFERRTGNDVETELAAALSEIGHITRLRLVAKVDGPGKPKTEGELSTHVLDAAQGRPAASMYLELFEVGSSARSCIAAAMTDADGRAPLLGGGPLRIGTYQLQFHVGAYYASCGVAAATPPYLEMVPVRFAIAEPESHYHVPLIVTPWSHTSYRGGG